MGHIAILDFYFPVIQFALELLIALVYQHQ
jgi:hypothetical protein